MALLDLAVNHARAAGGTVHALHFDHAQRTSSGGEAAFVARHCERLGVPFHSERMSGDASEPALDEGRLRTARYEFFGRAMERAGATILLLAHHADDRAETLLMRLMRGSGPTGLASIRPVETLNGLTLVRPLLEFRRTELREYLQALGLDWIEDPSNVDPRFKRAWVRAELLPLMNECMGMDITPRLLRASSLIEEEAAALRSACRLVLESLSLPPEAHALGILRLDDPLWRDASPEFRRALLRHWLWDLRRGGHPPGFETVREALNFVERGEAGGKLRTVERIHLSKEGGRLVARPDPDAEGEGEARG